MMKTNIVLIISICLVIGLSLVGVCAWSVADFGRRFINNSLNSDLYSLRSFKLCFNRLPFIDKLDHLLADKTYIVLLQNNRELRPSGGFMGSYAVLSTQNSGLRDVKIQDIYVPDGQIAGHVDPPAPIHQAFGQGWWKLRDANWDPDFTIAAPQIAWFFEQGGEKIDGLVAINLSLVNSLLGVLGEIKPTDYGDVVTANTFYNLAQKYAEVGFFPGSTQKRDFLGAVGNGLFKRIKQSKLIEQIKIIKLIYTEFKRGEILVWLRDQKIESGALGHHNGDYLYVVETNLGANKANCCVSREVTQTVDSLSSSLRIKYKNDNFFENPKPPEFWGGNYIDYLRIVLPKSAQIKSVKVGDKQLVEKPLDNQYGLQEDRYQVEDGGQFRIIGFWAVVPAQQTVAVELNYQLSIVNSPFNILVKHQPGMGPFLYKLIVNGKLVGSDTIDRDKEYQWTK